MTIRSVQYAVDVVGKGSMRRAQKGLVMSVNETRVSRDAAAGERSGYATE